MKSNSSMWFKESDADAGVGGWRMPAFWLAGELRRCVPAKSCQTWLCGAKVRSLCVMRKLSAVYLLRGYNWRGAFVGLS